MEQKYRMLEVGEWTQQGDEVLVFAHGWGKVLTWPMFVDDYCFGRLRRPVVATEDKQQLESMTKSWYDQRAELADARNEITDLTRRLEDALSEKVIAEKHVTQLESKVTALQKDLDRSRKDLMSETDFGLRTRVKLTEERNESIAEINRLREENNDSRALVAALKKILSQG